MVYYSNIFENCLSDITRGKSSEISAWELWPWHVHIVSTEKNIECTGVLVSSTVVLTAAHCFNNYDFSTENVQRVLEPKDFINLYAGFDDTSEILNRRENPQIQKSEARVEDIHVHPHWLSGSHDLALIVLDHLQLRCSIQTFL